jgi:hypothetical protein
MVANIFKAKAERIHALEIEEFLKNGLFTMSKMLKKSNKTVLNRP